MGVVRRVALIRGMVGMGGCGRVAVASFSSPLANPSVVRGETWCHGWDPRDGCAAALAVAAGRRLTSRSRSAPCCRQSAATLAAAAEEKPCRETSGVTVYSSKISATKSSTPCAALSCSSIVTSGIGVAVGIGQHTVPLVSPEVKSDVRRGEGRAMGERPSGFADEIEQSRECTQNCIHSWYETARVSTKAVVR